MPRVALLVSYDGTPYSGWTGIRDVILRPTLKQILQQDVFVDAASRTDAGVHARGQVCCFPYEGRKLDAGQLAYSLNQLLPPEMCVRRVVRVPMSFDPRSNLGKEYCYQLSVAECRDPLNRLYEWHLPRRRGAPPWDATAASAAAALLQNREPFDLAAFHTTQRGPQRKQPIDGLCRLERVAVQRIGLEVYRITIRGDRFLYKMVRNIVGTLVEVGLGNLGCHQVEDAIVRGNFASGRKPRCAPANGLVLQRVMYESDPFEEVGSMAEK